MEKEFSVKSSSSDEIYTVIFTTELPSAEGEVRACCTCPAGRHGTLCKHIIGLMESDEDIKSAMHESGQDKEWGSYKEHAAELEALKKKVAKEKKAFGKAFTFVAT
ncbi:MAG: SWIM zinc finger family protein [Oscillospiraceae bacterium]|nr:SWIM zinc finger family protein [Oscillospiraceae bacterium]